MTKILRYNSGLMGLARKKRNESTLSEILLWQKIKGKQLGYKFQRQKVIDNFILDFYCTELCLAIEIDGASHGDKIIDDKLRQDKLENMGVKFLRFMDGEIKNDLDQVIASIQYWTNSNPKTKFI